MPLHQWLITAVSESPVTQEIVDSMSHYGTHGPVIYGALVAISVWWLVSCRMYIKLSSELSDFSGRCARGESSVCGRGVGVGVVMTVSYALDLAWNTGHSSSKWVVAKISPLTVLSSPLFEGGGGEFKAPSPLPHWIPHCVPWDRSGATPTPTPLPLPLRVSPPSAEPYFTRSVCFCW